MPTSVQHWDSFTSRPGKGNPAGIVLAAQNLSDVDMQAIATSIGFNDTAFILPSQCADFRIRYFAIRREVDLCGHATIAAFSALHHHHLLPQREGTRDYTLETRAGVLEIGIDGAGGGDPVIEMNQGLARFAPFNGSRERLAAVLGIAADDLDTTLPIMYGSTGRWTLVVPVTGLKAMQKIRPSPTEFPAVLTDSPDASIHPFCRETVDAGAHLHARHFSSPASGTLEDAVTGTASGVLGAYEQMYITDGLKHDLPRVVEQGYEIGREGVVKVWATRSDAGCEVRIAGSACYVRDIEIG
jgi:trans-2,3-dihydro-3-hydroxyanthranilate isomerase